ncbi:MAG TPA: YggS family pyridoxal phosphate-dependent enzyme [Ktedonobacterales bacterium]
MGQMGSAMEAPNMLAELGRRASDLRERVAAAAERAGRHPDDVTIIAVSKTVPVETLRAAYDLGFTIFGENRVQEAQGKIAAWGDAPVRWELIGHLQSNKAARAVELFARIQSLDSLHLADALNARAEQRGHALPVLLEVNVAGEASKTGFAPGDVVDAARALAAYPALRPEGLMTIAPLVADPEEVRPVFQRLRALRDELRRTVVGASESDAWSQLSMGMTDDFEVAIEEGATIIRIGRGLFGSRPLVQPSHTTQDH